MFSALKYFKQDHPDLPVIATGSMVRLSIRHNDRVSDAEGNGGFLFLVGAIDSINVYPLNFEEYLLNTNKVLLERIRSAYKSG